MWLGVAIHGHVLPDGHVLPAMGTYGTIDRVYLTFRHSLGGQESHEEPTTGCKSASRTGCLHEILTKYARRSLRVHPQNSNEICAKSLRSLHEVPQQTKKVMLGGRASRFMVNFSPLKWADTAVYHARVLKTAFVSSQCGSTTPHQSRIAGRVRDLFELWKKIAGPWHSKVIKEGIPLQWVGDPSPSNCPFDSAIALQGR